MRPDINTLKQMFPMQPVFGGVGPHHLLLYSHHYNRGKLIVARTKEALQEAWAAHFKHNDEGAPIAYVEANIVSPPGPMQELYATRKWNEEVCSFAMSITLTMLPDYQSVHGGALPPGITMCQNFRSKYSDEAEESEYHSGCRNCVDQYVADWGALYLKYRDALAAFQSRERVEREARKQIVRNAPHVAHDPAQPLYLVSQQQGHWSDPEPDSIFQTVKREDLYGNEYFPTENPYLFFQGTITDVREDPVWVGMLRRFQTDAKRLRKERDRELEAQGERCKRENAAFIEGMFK